MTSFAGALRSKLETVLPHGSLRARLAHGVIWNFVGAVLTQAVAAVAAVLVARALGKTRYGELGMVYSTIAMFGTVAGLALGQMVSKHTAELRVVDPARAGRILGLSTLATLLSGIVVTVVLFFSADALARRALAAPHLAGYIRVASPLMLTGAIAAVQNAALTGFEAFRQASLYTTIVGVVTGVLAVAGARVYGVGGALAGNVAGAVVGLILFRIGFMRLCRAAGIRVAFRDAWQERRLLITFALPALLTALSVTPVTWAAAAFLVNTPGGYGEMGLYNAANQWRTLLLFLPSLLVGPLLPMMCQLYATGKLAQFRTVLFKTLYINVSVVGAMALVIALLAPFIMRLYGPGFEAGTPALWALCFVALFLSAGNVVGNLLISTGAMWTAFAFNGLWSVVLLVSAYFLNPRYGALGLAGAYGIAYLVHTVVQLCYLWLHGRRTRPVAAAATAEPTAL